MSPEELRAAGQIVRMQKEAATGSELIGHAAGFLSKVPKAVKGGFRHAGKEITEAAALEAGKPGVVAKALGKAVEHTPEAALAGGAIYYGTQPAREYMGAKQRQFQARQVQTRPYYDPTTGRFM